MIEENADLNTCQPCIKLTKAMLDYSVVTNNIKTKTREKTFNVMNNYIYKYYKNQTVKDINYDFFEKFYVSYMPACFLSLTNYQLKELTNEWNDFIDYVEKKYYLHDIKNVYKEVYNNYGKELQRIFYVSKEIRKYGEMPIMCWDPIIVDIKCYRNMKNQEKNKSKYIIYNQGYFQIEDKIGNNIIFAKTNNINECFKIKIDMIVALEMKIGDIAHMSIKRKMFSTSWNIINMKGFYNNKALKYLNIGGHVR